MPSETEFAEWMGLEHEVAVQGQSCCRRCGIIMLRLRGETSWGICPGPFTGEEIRERMRREGYAVNCQDQRFNPEFDNTFDVMAFRWIEVRDKNAFESHHGYAPTELAATRACAEKVMQAEREEPSRE